MAEVLKASWILPISGPPLRNGWIRVEDGRITALGSGGGVLGRDLGRGVLMPGLINAHCHLELSHLAGRITSQAFVPWVGELVLKRREATREVVRARVGEAVSGMVEGGTAGVGDISNDLDHLDLLAASPLRAVVFYELLAWDPARAGEVFEGARGRLEGLPPGPPEVRLAAHAPHSVSPDLFRRLGARVRSLHLAESPAEATYLREGGGEWVRFLAERGLGHVPFQGAGVSPVAYARSLGVLHPGLLAAHCVQVDAADLRLLKESGCAVVVCPRSNRTLGVGAPPVEALLKAGIPVCLGTDSLASAPTLDVWDDVLALRDTAPGIPPSTLLRMATVSGADALGLRDLGTLEPGKGAALAFVPLEADEGDPCLLALGGRPRRVAA
jgi:cytosine/adenosine deaminase-related metal-dependent hydrolase